MNLDEIIGHKIEVAKLLSLKNRGEIPHAMLFTGQRGIGKRVIAEEFIKSVICSDDDSPCGVCSSCRQISSGTFPDYMVLEKDMKGKIPLGNRDRPEQGSVRWLIDRLSRTPVTGRYSIVIDGVDTISEAGQNALLKTIEEPASPASLILIGERRRGILPTIISRCVEVRFQPLNEDEVCRIIASETDNHSHSDLFCALSGGSVETALRFHDDNVFDELKMFSMAISSFVKETDTSIFKFGELKAIQDNDFLLTALINIYSYMIRISLNNGITLLPPEMTVNYEDAVKITRILLALKRGLGNNLNVKNILKGFLYTYERMDRYGFPEPDFSWVI